MTTQGITRDDLKDFTKDTPIPKDLEFWYIESKEGKRDNITLSQDIFLDYLTIRHGICQTEMHGELIYIKYDNNVIEKVTPDLIKAKVIAKDKGHIPSSVYEKLIKSNMVRHDRLAWLRISPFNLHRDTENEAFFYFPNGFVKVTKDSISLHDYSELHDAHIWQPTRDRCEHHISIEDTPQIGDFERFIENVATELTAMQSAIGYLLHRYKNVEKPKAIVFMDSKVSKGKNDANGGSGKTLICDAIGQMRNLVTLDGRRINAMERFALQQIQRSTELVNIDDLRSNFETNPLFKFISGAMDIEQKGRDKLTIPYSESPKIAITTNYSFTDNDDSTERRRHEIILNNRYNKTYQPSMDFNGRQFFIHWNKNDWNEFYNFMFRCTQTFLKHGLVDDNKEIITRRKVAKLTDYRFYDFMELFHTGQLHIKENKGYYSLKSLSAKWTELYGEDFGNNKKLKNWIEEYYSLNYMIVVFDSSQFNNQLHFRYRTPENLFNV